MAYSGPDRRTRDLADEGFPYVMVIYVAVTDLVGFVTWLDELIHHPYVVVPAADELLFIGKNYKGREYQFTARRVVIGFSNSGDAVLAKLSWYKTF